MAVNLLKPLRSVPLLCNQQLMITRCLSVSVCSLRVKRPSLDIPAPPKKPIGPFILFLKDNMNKVDRLPENNRPDMKRIGAMWQELEDSEKQRYKESYVTSKAVYETEFKQFLKNIGGKDKQDEYLKQLSQYRSDRCKYLANYRLKKLGLIKPTKKSAMNNFMSGFLKGKTKEELLTTALKDGHAKWKSLSDEEKKAHTREAEKLYKQRLKEYEKRLSNFSK